jgi:hypothetical protein
LESKRDPAEQRGTERPAQENRLRLLTGKLPRAVATGLFDVAEIRGPLPLFGGETTELAWAGLQIPQPSSRNSSNLTLPSGPNDSVERRKTAEAPQRGDG